MTSSEQHPAQPDEAVEVFPVLMDFNNDFADYRALAVPSSEPLRKTGVTEDEVTVDPKLSSAPELAPSPESPKRIEEQVADTPVQSPADEVTTPPSPTRPGSQTSSAPKTTNGEPEQPVAIIPTKSSSPSAAKVTSPTKRAESA